MTQGLRVEMELPCALTDEEVQSRGRMLGETIWTIDETTAARTAAMKEFKERLVGLNETQRKLARVIRNRVENRMVYCAVHYHVPGEGLKRIIRTDTGEVVSEVEMTEPEKQLHLFASQRDFESFMEQQKPELEDRPERPKPEASEDDDDAEEDSDA